MDNVAGSDRADLLLAEWFAGGDPSPGADEVWAQLGRGQDLPSISLRPWAASGDLEGMLLGALASALPQMSGPDDADGFQQSYGGKLVGQYTYFNIGAAATAEEWQVLSPIRASAGGVNEMNRLLQRSYRAHTLDLARNKDRYARKIRSQLVHKKLFTATKSSTSATEADHTTTPIAQAFLSMSRMEK